MPSQVPNGEEAPLVGSLSVMTRRAKVEHFAQAHGPSAMPAAWYTLRL